VTAAPAAERAGLGRRLLSLVYEALLVAALVLAGMIPFVLIAGDWTPAFKRPLSQLYLVLLVGVYFVWQWVHGGQTLAMKTWRLKLVARDGRPLTLRVALRRYVFALAGVASGGIGLWWALLDRDRQFLHDRLAGTRIIFVPAARSSPPPR